MGETYSTSGPIEETGSPKRLMSVQEFLRAGGPDNLQYLPHPLRDFHNAKDVFKAMHEWLASGDKGKDRGETYQRPSWINGICYINDEFLRFMAAHGWTMQRSRAAVDFISLAETIKERRQREADVLQLAFARSKAKREGGSDA